MKIFNQIKDLIASVEQDADKFYNSGNSAAGTRVRKCMEGIKNLASQARKQMSEIKNKAK